MAARRALRFVSAAAASNVHPETLEELRHEVARLAVEYPRRPLTAILGDLLDVQDVTFRLLEGRQPPNATRDLYFLAGVTSGMLAKASHDLRDPHSAMTQARTAYVCADQADHNALRAWVRGLQSLVSYWAGWPTEAVRYARLGAEAARHVTGTSAVWLASLEARAWAVLGNAAEARAAIKRAEHARENVRPDDLDDLGGLLTFPRPKQLYYTADTTVWLPDEGARAEEEARAAIEAYAAAPEPERSFSDEAGARADLAFARVTSGELEGAREALRPVLDLPAEQRIGGVVTSTMRVHEALRGAAHARSPLARETQEAIEAFCRTSAAAVFPR